MLICKDAHSGNTPRPVERGVNSHFVTEVGVHWLRISFPNKYLREVVGVTSQFFDSEPSDRFGLWGYDRSYRWLCSVSILYDIDEDKARFHNNRAYFECPGCACDELTPTDLALLMQIFKERFEGRGERIDIFLDDYGRRIDPRGVQEIVKRGDYSRFRQFHLRQSYDHGNRLVYDSVIFGSIKKNWVKQLECYDKGLESNGEKDCIRWEAKFREDKADNVLTKLAGTCGNLDAFALLCGCIVVGCITFVYRVEKVKNISRLDVYEFWELIKKGLADLRIRSHKKRNTITGIIEWTKRQVAPNLACLSKVFKSEKQFFAWIVEEILHDGECRLNPNQRDLVDRFSGTVAYRCCTNPDDLEKHYLNVMCDLRG